MPSKKTIPVSPKPKKKIDNSHKKRTDEEIADALTQCYGTMTNAAKLLGMAPRSLYYRLDQNPELKQVRKDARDALVDVATLQLVRRMNAGSDAAIIFCLKTQGRDQGWDERPQYVPPSVTINLELAQALDDLSTNPDFRRACRVVEEDSDPGLVGNARNGIESQAGTVEAGPSS